MLHRFPDTDDFGQRIQEAELDYLVHSRAARTHWPRTMSGCLIRAVAMALRMVLTYPSDYAFSVFFSFYITVSSMRLNLID